MAVTIRRATPADRDVIAGLWQELYEYHLKLDPRERLTPDARDQFGRHLEGLLQADDTCFLLAEENGVPVGFISGSVRELPAIMFERVEGSISDALVTARCRGRGVGEQLFRAMAEWFRQCGVQTMALSVASTNPVSHAFWSKMGFHDYRIRMRGELK